MKKILVGFALVAVLCMVAVAGYHFGQALAQHHKARQAQATG